MLRPRLLLFLAAVFALKLIVVAELRSHPLLQPDAGIDTTAYVALAERVRAGDLLLGPGLYYVSPLYIYWLAAALTLGGSFTAVRVFQVALGTAAIGLIFVAARRWFGLRAAWIAAGVAALTGIFSFYEALLLQSSLDPFLTAASLAALAVGLTSDRHGRVWLFGAGVAFGVQTLNRPNVLVPALVVVGLLAAARRWRMASLVGAGLIVALAPASIRNATVAGTWSPLASHGGLNLYIGNNAAADGTYHSVPGITPDIEGQERDARRVAEGALNRPLSDAQVSAYFVGLATTWMREHPAAAVRLMLKKIAYTFGAAHVPLNDSYPFYAYDAKTILRLLPIGAWILVPLGLAGLVFRETADRSAARREPWSAGYLMWASFVPAYAVAVAAFFAADRYRLPLLVPMCIGAGALVDRVLSHGVRQAGAALAVAGALAVGVNWPVHLDDGRGEERTRMAEVRAAAGDTREADDWIARAEAAGADPAVVNLRAGRASAQAGHASGAVRYLGAASAAAPGRAEIDYAYGQALLDAGRPADAVPHLRAAVSAGVRPDVAGADLVRALTAVGDRRGAREALERVTPANAADEASWIALGDLAVALEAGDLEQRFYGRAVEAAPGDPVAQLNLAVALAQAGRFDEARAHASEALRLNPSYAKARGLLDALDRSRRER